MPDAVLLVVADARLRTFALAQLQEEGYQVVAVPDFNYARRLLSRGLRPRLVVTDLQGISEAELQGLATAGLAVLAVVGQLEREKAARTGVAALVRPFTVAQLVECVRSLLGPPEGGKLRP